MVLVHKLLDEIIADHWKEISVANCAIFSLWDENFLTLFRVIVEFGFLLFVSHIGIFILTLL